MSHLLKFDGASQGNPGPASAGAVCYSPEGNKVFETGKALGHATNNVAEYSGLIEGLAAALKLGVKHLLVKGDSQLIINQMLGIYAVKDERLAKLYREAKELEAKFETIEYQWVRREFNSDADALTKEVLREKLGFYREFVGAEPEPSPPASPKPASPKPASPKPIPDKITMDYLLNFVSQQKPQIQPSQPAKNPLERLGHPPPAENVLSQLFAGHEEPAIPKKPAIEQTPADKKDSQATLDQILLEVREIRKILQKE